MAKIPLDPFPAEPAGPNTSFPITRLQDGSVSGTNIALNSVIDQPRLGEFKREMMTWRTPHLGYVKMYINPQNLKISDAKDISTTRTKGGFVIQYAGEQLTQISISGTTGSAGIEGINILRSIYRSEQEAYEGFAVALDEKLSSLQFDTLFNTVNQLTRVDLIGLGVDALRGNGRPQPTLASLASNIEMSFQGVLYRGFFKSFSVDEMAASPGHFSYQMMFEAYGRQGIRRNFTAWHRQPFNPADTGSNPFTFTTLIPEETVGLLPPSVATDNKDVKGSNPPNLLVAFRNSLGRRSTDTAVGNKGRSITDNDLRNK